MKSQGPVRALILAALPVRQRARWCNGARLSLGPPPPPRDPIAPSSPPFVLDLSAMRVTATNGADLRKNLVSSGRDEDVSPQLSTRKNFLTCTRTTRRATTCFRSRSSTPPCGHLQRAAAAATMPGLCYSSPRPAHPLCLNLRPIRRHRRDPSLYSVWPRRGAGVKSVLPLFRCPERTSTHSEDEHDGVKGDNDAFGRSCPTDYDDDLDAPARAMDEDETDALDESDVAPVTILKSGVSGFQDGHRGNVRLVQLIRLVLVHRARGRIEVVIVIRRAAFEGVIIALLFLPPCRPSRLPPYRRGPFGTSACSGGADLSAPRRGHTLSKKDRGDGGVLAASSGRGGGPGGGARGAAKSGRGGGGGGSAEDGRMVVSSFESGNKSSPASSSSCTSDLAGGLVAATRLHHVRSTQDSCADQHRRRCHAHRARDQEQRRVTLRDRIARRRRRPQPSLAPLHQAPLPHRQCGRNQAPNRPLAFHLQQAAQAHRVDAPMAAVAYRGGPEKDCLPMAKPAPRQVAEHRTVAAQRAQKYCPHAAWLPGSEAAPLDPRTSRHGHIHMCEVVSDLLQQRRDRAEPGNQHAADKSRCSRND